MLPKSIRVLRRRLQRRAVEAIDAHFDMRAQDYGSLRLFSGHFRVRHRNKYALKKEADLVRFIEALPAGVTMWDVGGNVGFFALYAGQRGVNVLVFEPDQLSCGIINKNVFLNNLSNRVICLPVALPSGKKVTR